MTLNDCVAMQGNVVAKSIHVHLVHYVLTFELNLISSHKRMGT